jgi:hypothetical protein
MSCSYERYVLNRTVGRHIDGMHDDRRDPRRSADDVERAFVGGQQATHRCENWNRGEYGTIETVHDHHDVVLAVSHVDAEQRQAVLLS